MTRPRDTQIRFTAPKSVTISSGAVTVDSAVSRVYIVAAESGTEDDLDTLTGYENYDVFTLIADTGDVIKFTGFGDRDLYFTDDYPIQVYHNGTEWKPASDNGLGWKSKFISSKVMQPNGVGPCGSHTEFYTNLWGRSFADAVISYANFEYKFPDGWSGDYRVRYVWSTATNLTGAVTWSVRESAAGDGEALDAVVFHSVQTDTSHATAGYLQHTTWSEVISESPGDTISVSPARVGNGTSDTMAGTAYLIGVEVEYLMYKPER